MTSKSQTKRIAAQKAPEPVSALRKCGCIDAANKALEPRNTGLDVVQMINFKTGREGEALRIATFKLGDGKGKAIIVFARHCPFCGASFNRPGVLGQFDMTQPT